MKPAILLYNPPATKSIKDWIRPFPLNLLSICSLLDTDMYNISVSQEMPTEAYEEFKDAVRNAVCIGISCMTGVQITHGLALAGKIREVNPSIPIVWGGYHPTAMPEQTLQNQYVDIVVRGYGEETFAELVDCFIQRRSIDQVDGISYMKGDKCIQTPLRRVPDLNDMPPIPYHIFDVEEFFRVTGEKTLHYISSRGCPHQCGFCADFVIYRRKWNALSADRVLEDLLRLYDRYGFDAVRFYDSNLFVSEKRIQELCKSILKTKLRFRWLKCNGDAKILRSYSSETIELMYEAGVSNVLIGAESGYENALEIINKAATSEDNISVIKTLHKHNISIGFSYIFGFPYDLPPKQLFKEHIKELGATMLAISEHSSHYIEGDYYLLFIFTPYPGVRLYDRYQQLGFIPPDSFDAWSATNLNETNSCSWLDKKLLISYQRCLIFNWFFMHKLERNFLKSIRFSFIRKGAVSLDLVCCKILQKRIGQGDLRIPIILKQIWFYYGVKSYIARNGIRGFCVEVQKRILKRSIDQKKF